jgi:hypothetical protein
LNRELIFCLQRLAKAIYAYKLIRVVLCLEEYKDAFIEDVGIAPYYRTLAHTTWIKINKIIALNEIWREKSLRPLSSCRDNVTGVDTRAASIKNESFNVRGSFDRLQPRDKENNFLAIPFCVVDGDLNLSTIEIRNAFLAFELVDGGYR